MTLILHLSVPVRDLAEARRFYELGIGCDVGRVGPDWLDVWFFGLQLTLQQRPDEVRAADAQGVRHFGVTMPDVAAYDELVERLRRYGARWVTEPTGSAAPGLSGKVGAKVADPSGNVIEIKYYPDPSQLRARQSTSD